MPEERSTDMPVNRKSPNRSVPGRWSKA